MQEFSKKLIPIEDEKIKNLKKRFFSDPQKIVSRNEFIEQADKWFMSTRLNQLHSVDQFAQKDIIIGCTQFIEHSSIAKRLCLLCCDGQTAYRDWQFKTGCAINCFYTKLLLWTQARVGGNIRRMQSKKY